MGEVVDYFCDRCGCVKPIELLIVVDDRELCRACAIKMTTGMVVGFEGSLDDFGLLIEMLKVKK